MKTPTTIPWHLRVGLGAALLSFAAVSMLPAQTPADAARSTPAATDVFPAGSESVAPPDRRDAITRIREEGLQRSQVMKTLSYLTDVIGPRLTGSPNLKRANDWTRDQLTNWGLENACLEPWGPFGRGWSLKRFSAQIVEPYAITLIAYPKAWSPGLKEPVVADVVYLDARTEADLEKFKGKLKGAVVLLNPVREVRPRFEPLALRIDDPELLRLANASSRAPEIRPGTGGGRRGGGGELATTNAPARGGGRRGGGAAAVTAGDSASTNAPGERLAQVVTRGGGPGGRGGGRGGGAAFSGRTLAFCLEEGAALAVSPSTQGDGGTVFVSSASLPTSGGRGGFGGGANAPRYYSTNSPPTPPQIMLATEDYNRLVRMIQQGAKPKMAVEFDAQFHDDDLYAYNTTAEIPGSDLRDEIVMLGGHIDSWQAGTGATDNGAGVAAAMEAVRIIKALNLKPRRTIRIGLWSGEEQGLMGSRAYVTEHFGYYTNEARTALRSPRAASEEGDGERIVTAGASTNAPTRRLVRKKEYEKLSGYFNVDNGAGKIRGVYLQGNDGVRPLFRKWLEPFADLGAETITLSNTSGTDHQSFDNVGLPGFQFIQDPLDYWTRTHHSNEDVYDRVPPEDMKQIATIFAAFVWNAATTDERLPRKPATP